jgi:membrane associated rhomboid family serine protease
VSVPPSTGPDFTAPSQQACYRHPDRPTGISCQRCHRPICGECMNPAAVGFQCPSCVSTGRAGVRAPRSRFGGVLTPGGGNATKILMGVLVAVYVLDLITGGLVANLMVLSNFLVHGGQYWRLLTYGFTSVGLLGLLMNLLVLWLAGRAMEQILGTWRFVALYVLAGLGGASLSFVLGPFSLAAAGASSAVVGLLAANAIVKLRAREDIRPDISLLILLTLYSILVGFRSFGWLGLVGGIGVGALVGYILAYAPRANRSAVQLAGLVGVAVLCAVGVAAKLAVS